MFGTKEFRSVTREELYDLVWSKPMTKLAADFGISDVGLRKICKRADIPLPPGGYWMKLQFGKRVRKPPLPPLKPGKQPEIRIAPTPKKIEVQIDVPAEIAGAIEHERAEPNEIPIPQSPKPHPIVASWGRARQATYGTPTFTPATEARRRRIATVLFREIEKRGGKIAAEGQEKFKITLFRRCIEVSLKERMKQVQVPLSESERKYSWNEGRESKNEMRPCGLLRLKIQNWFTSPVQSEWKETEEKPLEGKLRDVIVGLYVAAAALQRQAEAKAERERREWEEQQRRRDIEKQQRKERERVEALLADANAWAQARRLREFVDAMKGTATDEWTRWARGVADSLDPTCRIADEALQEHADESDDPL